MTPDQRKALADALIADYGLTDLLGEQFERNEAFLADPANKEFAQYKAWSSAVRDYPGGPEAYWQAAIGGGNENARLYIEGLSADLTPPEPERTSLAGGGIYDPVNIANQIANRGRPRGRRPRPAGAASVPRLPPTSAVAATTRRTCARACRSTSPSGKPTSNPLTRNWRRWALIRPRR